MIRLNNVTKKYGDTVIFEGASYAFPQRGIVCLVGASGGGKTTLLNLLAGFDSDYDGEILVGDTAINQMDAEALCDYRRNNIGFVFQNYHLLSGYTVLENVTLACKLTESDKENALQKAGVLLDRLGIGEKGNEEAENLSGGQKQRVAIARALINDPQIIFADEPTGALDRASSTEIMELLREISQDRLVVVITHDPKICDFADEIIHISNKQIEAEKPIERDDKTVKPLIFKAAVKAPAFSRGLKNFRVHIKRYIAVALAISIGVLAFLLSLSFGNVMEGSIQTFKEKNTAFNNGYIKGADDGTIFEYLTGDERIENVYYQYKLGEMSLTLNGKTEPMPEKFPTAKATQGLSYGHMPRGGQSEIALTPSLAKKFDSDIKRLLGKTITLTLGDKTQELVVSGIYNAGYDDFFVSAEEEKRLYEGLSGEENYSISYDVKDFSDVVAVSDDLKQRDISSENAAKEVAALQQTFESLGKLFFVLSILILAVGVFICAVLLTKLQNTRYRELGLLSALGFSRQQIASMISVENAFISGLATLVTLVLLGGVALVGGVASLPIIIGGAQIVLSVVATFAFVALLSGGASRKLLRIEPAEALRK